MSVLPFFGKNRFEKHKTGLFDGLRSTIFENTNFTVSEQIQQVFFLFVLICCFLFCFWPLNPSCLKQAMIKTSPLIPGLEQDLHSRTLVNGGYCRSGTGT